MNELTHQELQFLIDISEQKRTNQYSNDVVTENTVTHDVDIYFIIQKLEKQLNTP